MPQRIYQQMDNWSRSQKGVALEKTEPLKFIRTRRTIRLRDWHTDSTTRCLRTYALGPIQCDFY